MARRKTTAQYQAENRELRRSNKELEERVDEQGKAIAELRASLEAIRPPNGRSTDAQHHPVEIRQAVAEPLEEQDLGAAEFTRDINTGGETPVLVDPRPEPMDHPAQRDKLSELRFNEDILRVYIPDTSEEHADGIFHVQVNQDRFYFVRGQEFDVPRKFVEGLFRAKPISYRSEEFTDHDGVRRVRYPKRQGPRYAFQILRDPAGARGREWAERLKSEAA